jgi:menaquinone-dependent protoporphyrinogen IX oxidase
MEQVERIDDYQAVVVGSGVYMNRWLKPGTDFLKRESPDAEGSVEAAAASASAPSAPRASESGWIGSAPVAT